MKVSVKHISCSINMIVVTCIVAGYLDEWDRSVNEREGFTPADTKKMRLSDETLEGLRVTGMYCDVHICTK